MINRNRLKMRKMALALAASLIIALCLTACGRNGSGTGADSSQGTEQDAGSVSTSQLYEGENWSVYYDPSEFEVSEQDGETHFVYTGESAGSDLVAISYHEDKMPQEVLYDKTSSYDDSQIDRSEGYFGAGSDWAFTYSVYSSEGSGLNEQLTGVEHNGGTLLVDILMHSETEVEDQMRVSDALASIVDSLNLTDHKEQTQFSYVPGVYAQTIVEEMEGVDQTFVKKVSLYDDHTGVLSIQDDIDIHWSSTELIGSDFRYEYTIEGSSLLVNVDGSWETYEKVGGDSLDYSDADN